MEISVRKMYDAKMHFGHRARFWNPKMAPYIYGKFGTRNKIHIIDLDKSLPLFKKALAYVRGLASQGGVIMLVSTRRVTADLIEREATRCEMPYVNRRWLGGTLTNFSTVYKSVGSYQQMLAREERGEIDRLSKKEAVNVRRKILKMKNMIGGINEMKRLPDALFIVDVGYEKNALNEAVALGIPVVGIVDTNNSYKNVDYMIPGNDDAISAVELYAGAIADAVIEGRAEYKLNAESEDSGDITGDIMSNKKMSDKKISSEKTTKAKTASAGAEPEVSPSSQGAPRGEGVITAGLVKTLRERTGAGMMKCKDALKEVNGDLEAAVRVLRKSGQAQAAKRAGRTAAEGVITIASDVNAGHFVMLEVNCETDFVARDEKFAGFVGNVAQAVLSNEDTSYEILSELKLPDGKTVEESRQDLITQIGENIQVRRFVRVKLSGDRVAGYVHGGEQSGRIGVLVDVTGGDDTVAKDIALHIAASSPICVSPEQIPPEVLAKEKEIYESQAQESGKPAEIVTKIVEGKMRKFCDEATLLGQPFVKDPDQSVGNYIKQHKASINAFWRYEVGERLEEPESSEKESD